MGNTKRVCSSIRSSVVAVPVSDHIHHSKRIKQPSSSTAVATRPSSTSLNNINIGDLPDDVLVEILSRLPCYKYVSRCKCVSKLWCNLMSDPSFIVRFLCLQSDKQTQIIRTLINKDSVEFLNRLSLSGKPLSQLFKRLVSFYHLKEEPVVVGTYNDLVLCCASMSDHRDYYICNAYTYQWFLPPPPQVSQVFGFLPVGFICDLPYYHCRKNEDNRDQKRQCIQLNAEFRCRVVRLLADHENELSCKFKVQIFSSETGEWTESILITPSPLRHGAINLLMNFLCNGVLYWLTNDGNFLVGVDPFMITDRSSTSLLHTRSYGTHSDHSIDQYRCRFTDFDLPLNPCRQVLFGSEGVNRGCLPVLAYNLQTEVLSVGELNVEEVSTAAGKFCLDQRLRDFALDWGMVTQDDGYLATFPIGFDPNDDGTLYIYKFQDTRSGEIFRYNIHTRELIKIVEKSTSTDCNFYPLKIPWVPTPVPKLTTGTCQACQGPEDAARATVEELSLLW